MTISFSGLASGLDTSSWIESLVALRRAKVTTLQQEKEAISLSQNTLSSIKNFFNSFRSTIERITDTRFNIVSMDLFAQNIATSANLNVLTATATSEAEEGTYKVKVDKLATKTNAVSGYKYTTTIVEATTATANTKLSDLNVKSGFIGVTAGGNTTNIAITKDDTIATFIEKLQGAGVEASYNEKTGVFSMNISGSAIEDIDETGIKKALHINDSQVVEGYATQNALQIKKEESYWAQATDSTKLKDLGVQAGTMTIRANDAEYDITINDETTFGEFVQALKNNHIDADLIDGVFTLSDAQITDVGTTNIIDALGIESSIYSKSQSTGALTKETVITSTTIATADTKLSEIGERAAIADDSTVIVKNSNNEFTTITVGSESTIGDLLEGMSEAGLYATINTDGTVEISGGAITGGSFDALSALGLQTEPFSAMVTGTPLTETVIREEAAKSTSRLVEDLNITEGYIEVTDNEGNIFYEKISAGETISDFATNMSNYGINVNLDSTTGVLSITGGAFRTLADDEAKMVTGDDTATGTNLLARLYGSDTISTDHINISSSYAKSRTLTHTTTTVVNADTNSTLGSLGLTTNGTAEFNVRGELRTINVSSTMSINELMNALDAEGISATWDSSNSKISFNNVTLTGGTSDLSEVLNLTETISGKYVTSDAIYATNEFVSNATRDSQLSTYGINQEETVYLQLEDGSTKTLTVSGSTSLGTLIDTLNTMGVTATLENGIFSIDGGYLENTNLQSALGLNNAVNGQTSILGNEVTRTVTTAVTGSSKLKDIVSALGTSSAVSGGYNLTFNSTSLSVSDTTTVNDLMEQITAAGGSARLESTGRLHIDGGTLSGSVATALGFTSQSVISSVNATGETLTTVETVNADKSTKLSSIGVGETTITVHNADGTTAGTIDTTGDMTIQQVFDELSTLGVVGTMQDGVISLTSAEGKYITGDFATAIGMSTVVDSTTTTTGLSITSSIPITSTQSVVANSTTTFGELGFNSASTILVSDSTGSIGAITTSANMTLGEMFSALAGYGISGTITDGTISLSSTNGAYISGDVVNAMGITTEETQITINPGKTYASSVAVTYTETTLANGTTTLKELGVLTEGAHLTKAEAEALGYTWVTTRAELTAALTNSTANTKVMLGGDIDLSDGDWDPIADFKGTFDGNNYSINNMTIYSNTTKNFGFFSSTDGSNIKNISFNNTTINIDYSTNETYAFAVVTGANYNWSEFDNVSVTNTNFTINNSGTGMVYVAGLIGSQTSNCIITNSNISQFSVNASTNGNITAAGLIARCEYGLISQTKVDGLDFTLEDKSLAKRVNFGGFVAFSIASRYSIIQSETEIDNLNITAGSTYSGVIAGSCNFVQIFPAYFDEVYYTDNTDSLELFGSDSSNAIIGDIRNSASPISPSDLAVYDANGNLQGTIAVSETTTLDDIMAGLLNYGINGTISNGQIILNSPNGNYVLGSVASQLGITTTTNTTGSTIGASATSTAGITYTQETAATSTDKIGNFIKIEAHECDGVVTATSITGTTIGISTAEDLANLASAVAAGASTSGKTFVLLNDIDLSGYGNWTSIGSYSNSFRGTFDGNGYTISNLTHTTCNVDGTTGLFGYVQEATLENIKLDGVNITGFMGQGQYIGALAGYAYETSVENIDITGLNFNVDMNFAESYVGGAIAYIDSDTSSTARCIKNINIDGTISLGEDYQQTIGGIFGYVETNMTLEYLHSSVDIINGGSLKTGGLVGDCKTSASIIAQYCSSVGDTSGDIGGGLFGRIITDAAKNYYIKDSYYNGASLGSGFRGIVYTIEGGNPLQITNCGNTNEYFFENSVNYGSVTIVTTTTCVTGTDKIYLNFSCGVWTTTGSDPIIGEGPIASEADLTIKNSSGTKVAELRNVENMTFQELFIELNKHGINCSIDNGVITVDSTNGNYVDSKIWKKLGFEVLSTTTSTTSTTPLAVTSTAIVTYTATTTADSTTTLGSTKYVIDGSINSSSVTGSVIAISTATQLQYLARHVNAGQDMSGKTFVLTKDIDLSGITNWTAIGNNDNYFAGTFDGQGYTISNMNLDKTIASDGTGDNLVALFGKASGTVKNFTLKDANIKTENNSPTTVAQRVAGAVAESNGAKISGITIENINIEAGDNNSVGGIVGLAWTNTTITNCKTSGVISASDGVTDDAQYGGIIGWASATNLSLDTCQNEIDINASGGCTGGIIGLMSANQNVKIQNVLNKGDIENNYQAGGIIGKVSASKSSNWDLGISGAINMGKITASTYRSDIVGVFWVSSSATSTGSVQMTGCLGFSTTTTKTTMAYALLDETASGNYWTDKVTITETRCGRNLTLTSIKSSTYKDYFSIDKWSLGSNTSTTNLKAGDEYDIFVCNDAGLIQTTLDLNASNTIQDVVSGLQGYGTCTFSDGIISYSPTSTFNVAGTGTTFINTTSALNEKNSYSLTASSTLRQVTGSSATQKLYINQADGTSVTVSLANTLTIDEMLGVLAEYGISGRVTSGKLYLNKSTTGAYLTGGSSSLTSKLKLNLTNGKSYTVTTTKTTAYAGSTTSDRQFNNVEHDLDSSTKLSKIGLSTNATLTVVSNGTENVITLSPDQTIGDMLTTLAGYNISGSVVDGKLCIQASNSYISDMDTSLMSAFKLNNIADLYTVNYDVSVGNTNSYTYSLEKNQSLSSSTTLKDLGFYSTGYITVNVDGTKQVITVKSSTTVGDVMSALNEYGITSSISNGKLTMRGDAENYIISMTKSLKTALSLDAKANSTVAVLATGDTTFQELGLSDFEYTIIDRDGNITQTLQANATDSIQTWLTSLYQNSGIMGSIEDGVITFHSANYKYISLGAKEEAVLGSTAHVQGKSLISNDVVWLRGTIISEDTTMSELGLNQGITIAYNNGANTIDFSHNDYSCLRDWFDAMEPYGVNAYVEAGIVYITFEEGSWATYSGYQGNIGLSTFDTPQIEVTTPMTSSNVLFAVGETSSEYTNSNSSILRFETITSLTTSSTIGSLSPYRVDVVESQRVSNVSSFSSGQTYYIKDVSDLVALANLVNSGQSGAGAIFELASDIDLGAYCTESIANGNGGWTPIGTDTNAFSGTFNGNGHVIKNLKIDRLEDSQGLFGCIRNAKINNVGLEDLNINAKYNIGGLVGYSTQGASSTISNCYATGNISGAGSIGGLIGRSYVAISNCYVAVNITASDSNVGGLAGESNASISNCYATGSINSTSSRAGGLVGLSYASISNCYATGTVSAGNFAGGLVGRNNGSAAAISNCYATGSVSASSTYVGGLVGIDTSSNIRNCASVQSDSNSTQMTEEQIKSTYTPESMGFTNANGWGISTDGSPVLAWQLQLPLSGTITVVQNGTEQTVTVNSQDTISDVISKLSAYGIYGSVADGKLTFSGNANSYIKGMNSELANALELTGQSTTTTNTITTTTNTSSNKLSDTRTLAATDTIALQDLHLASDGSAPAGYELVISKTASGNTSSVTVTFTATSTLDDVIETLATHGIEASITSSGKFKVSSDSLSDFDISGDLGNYLMGSYTKNFNETSVNNTSGILSAESTIKMTDETTLSDVGVTSGNLEVVINGEARTITVDSTKSVGDLRLQLAGLGITGDIINGKIALNANGIVNFTTPAGGSNAVDVLGLNNINSSSDYGQVSKKLTSSGGSEGAATMQTQISNLKDSSGNNLGITSGQIYVYQDGTRNILNIDANETLESLATKLSQYGINMGISSDGKLYFDGNNNSYLTTEGLNAGSASNILTKLNIDDNWSTRYNSSSQILKEEQTENVKIDGSAKLVDLQNSAGMDLHINNGAYYIYKNGVRYTESISADTTVNEFLATLSSYGISANIAENGTITARAEGNIYLATSNTGNDTNAIDVLFGDWNFVNEYVSDPLAKSEEVTSAITLDTKLSDINGGNYQEGLITIVKDGIATNIELQADETVGSLVEKIKLYGFESVINSNGELIIKNNGDSYLKTYSGVAPSSNALEILGVDQANWVNTNTYESGTVSVVNTITDNVCATRDTLLSDLDVTAGEYYIYNNGVKYTALISSDDTVGSFMNTLESFGIQTSLSNNGIDTTLSIIGNGESYIAKSNSVSNASNIVDKLFTTSKTSNNYSAQKEVFITETDYITATEDTLLSTYDNGLTSKGDLSLTVNGVECIVKISAADTIGSFVEKLQNAGVEATYLDGKVYITNASINVTGTTSNVATNLGLAFTNNISEFSHSTHAVEKTTSTIEERTLSVANYANFDTQMSLIGITSGSLTIYRNGEKATVQIDANQTFEKFQEDIQASFADIKIKFDNGYITFYSDNPSVNINVGATTDTTNFSAITGVTLNENGEVKSSREMYCVNSSSKVTTEGIFRNGNVKEGTFRIGNADFTITDTTTLSNIITQINASEEANATAYWDSVDGKFVITSRTTGASLVNIEAGTSNFTDVMGLTSSEWADADSDGNPDIGESLAVKTKINIDNQVVGENARFAINGTYYTSTSNTITSDVSKIKGLTINLKGISEGETTITIERDKETLANAVSDVVDAYNNLIENVDKEIAKGSPLDDQFTLKLIRNQIRNLMTGSIATDGVFKNLSSIGISLEEASASNISTQNINKLTFDKDKFIKAFDADRDSLKKILVGTNSYDGIFQQVEKIVENSTSNFFMSAEKSYATQISRIDSKISKAETSLERYRARLEKKFESMDLLISQMQNQYSSFLGV